MSTRSLSALLAGIVFLLALLALPSLADDGLPFRILQPLPNYNVVNNKLPIAVTFSNPADAQVMRFESFLDGERLVWGRIRYPDGQPTSDFSFQTEADLSEMTPPPTAGAHTLVIKLYDSLGRMSQNQVQITVPGVSGTTAFTGKAPQVRIVSPANNSIVSGRTDIVVDAVSDAGIKFVIVTVDGKVYGVTTQLPYTIPWDPVLHGFTPGKYTIVASVIDMADNKATSTPITFTFDPSAHTNGGVAFIPGSGMSPPHPLQQVDIARIGLTGSLLPAATWGGSEVSSIGLILPLSPRREGSAVGAPQLAMLAPSKSDPGMMTMPLTDVVGSMSPARAPMLAQASATPPASYLSGPAPARTSLGLPSLAALPSRGDGSDHPMLIALAVPSIHLVNEPLVATNVPTPALSGSTVATSPADHNATRPVTIGPATPPAVSETSSGMTALAAALVPGQPIDSTPIATLMVPTVSAGKPVPGSVESPMLIAALPQSVATGLQPPLKGATPVTNIDLGAGTDTLAPRTVGTPLLAGSVEVAGLPMTRPTANAGSQPQMSTPAMGVIEPHQQPAMTSEPTIGQPAQSAGLSPLAPGLGATPGSDSHSAGSSPVNLDALATHTAQPGDTIEKIALAHGVTPADLSKLNPGLTPDRLPVGTKVVVPVPGVHFYLDGSPVIGRDGPYPDPFIVDGTSMVPIRLLLEANGGTVEWLPKTQEVNAWSDGTFVGVKIGDTTAHINTQTVTLAQPATIVADRTMVPIRFLMAALNLDLEYNPSSGTYSLINKENK